jgi:hypothetical protein
MAEPITGTSQTNDGALPWVPIADSISPIPHDCHIGIALAYRRNGREGGTDLKRDTRDDLQFARSVIADACHKADLVVDVKREQHFPTFGARKIGLFSLRV